MNKEDAKDLTLSILVIVVALLIADNIYLHCKTCAQAERLEEQKNTLVELTAKVEGHLNSPPQPGLKEKAKATYDKAKVAVKTAMEKIKAEVKGDND